jgi:hypothetical protein
LSDEYEREMTNTLKSISSRHRNEKNIQATRLVTPTNATTTVVFETVTGILNDISILLHDIVELLTNISSPTPENLEMVF